MPAPPRRFAEATKVPVSQSRAEIERLLARHRCAQYGTMVDHELQIARVQFRAYDRIVRFELALPTQAGPRPHHQAKREQEERRVWRALLLVIRAKLEAVENAIASFEEEFLAHIVMPNDQTVGAAIAPLIAEAYKRGQMPRALLAPAPEAFIEAEP